jgi:hypothetical protein
MNSNLLLAALAAAGLLVLIILLSAIAKRIRPPKLDRSHFVAKWQQLQSQCANQATWPLAIIDADKLLDEALKKHRYKGKTMGERMMRAQRELSDNDGAWFAHKLRNKIVHEDIKLKQRDVKDALQGFRQALRDLGAL